MECTVGIAWIMGLIFIAGYILITFEHKFLFGQSCCSLV